MPAPELAGVDVETQEDTDFHGVVSAEGRSKFPGGDGSHHFGYGGSGVGKDLMEVVQVSRLVHFALDHDTGTIQRNLQACLENVGTGEFLRISVAGG